jgi:tripartite-type tricarboxylate transporter receptor subunit TctC
LPRSRENYKEFEPLCQVQKDLSMFYVKADSPFKTMAGGEASPKKKVQRIQW